MDVKFPIDNYLRHLEAINDPERDATRVAFLRDVRTRVKELAHRGYADPITTAGYVLLFIPNDDKSSQEPTCGALQPTATASSLTGVSGGSHQRSMPTV